jgi:16S rRNA (guanine966-N2)-methyltransferase
MGLRIIGGKLKGRRLYTVRGLNIRPTADRLRETVFNLLAPQLADANVLDLFAGTGALGIEALSRGAESATFVDKSKPAISVIERNIRWCSLDMYSRVFKWDIIRNLNCLRHSATPINLVLIDPPYNKNMLHPTLRNLHQCHALDKETCIVVEHSIFEPLSEKLPGFNMLDQRRYGKTLVSFLFYMV